MLHWILSPMAQPNFSTVYRFQPRDRGWVAQEALFLPGRDSSSYPRGPHGRSENRAHVGFNGNTITMKAMSPARIHQLTLVAVWRHTVSAGSGTVVFGRMHELPLLLDSG